MQLTTNMFTFLIFCTQLSTPLSQSGLSSTSTDTTLMFRLKGMNSTFSSLITGTTQNPLTFTRTYTETLEGTPARIPNPLMPTCIKSSGQSPQEPSGSRYISSASGILP